jgi:diadenylate cyclase
MEPMGTNRWQIERCASVFSSLNARSETARRVASDCDCAVVVHNDGTIEEDMVRLKQLSTAESEQTDSLPYAGWMGA